MRQDDGVVDHDPGDDETHVRMGKGARPSDRPLSAGADVPRPGQPLSAPWELAGLAKERWLEAYGNTVRARVDAEEARAAYLRGEGSFDLSTWRQLQDRAAEAVRTEEAVLGGDPDVVALVLERMAGRS